MPEMSIKYIYLYKTALPRGTETTKQIFSFHLIEPQKASLYLENNFFFFL